MPESNINQSEMVSAKSGSALERSLLRSTAAFALIVFGAAMGFVSFELVSNRFGNTDTLGLFLFGLAGCIFVTGVSLFFLRLPHAILVGIIAAPLSVVLLFVLFWLTLFTTVFQNRDHQSFAANGASQIQPARQMDEVFDECHHYITYSKDSPVFNSVAYFGDRYELTMQVPVNIKSKTSGSVTGEPKFYLNEIESITVFPSGGVSTSYSRDLHFGSAEWQKVFESKGDFSTIGFDIKPTGVANFQKHVDASRP